VKKHKKAVKIKKIVTQSDIFKTASFEEIEISCFFESNGFLCLKDTANSYLRIDPNKSMVTSVIWNRGELEQVYIADMTYCYRRKIHAKRV
jgi:hypothetical protein